MSVDVLTYGAVRLLNVPHAEAPAREVYVEDCYRFDQIPAGSIVLDIGAFYGEFGIRCAVEKQCRVIAYEPSAENRAILKENCALNGLTSDQVSVSDAAVSTPGFRAFLHRPNHPAGSMLDHYAEANACAGAGNRYDVLCVGLLDEIHFARRHWGDHCVVVKMDCEGAEREIFAGNLAWIDYVDVIAMEWHYYDGAHFHDLIEPRGFEVVVEGGGAAPRLPWHPGLGSGLLFATRVRSRTR